MTCFFCNWYCWKGSNCHDFVVTVLFVRFIELFESNASIIIGHQLIDVFCNDNTFCHGYHHSFLQSEFGSGMQRIYFLSCCIVYVLATIVSEGRSADKYANDLSIGNLRLAAMNIRRFIHSFQICCRLCENDNMKQASAVLSKKNFLSNFIPAYL